jgi:hypothetical protein
MQMSGYCSMDELLGCYRGRAIAVSLMVVGIGILRDGSDVFPEVILLIKAQLISMIDLWYSQNAVIN